MLKNKLSSSLVHHFYCRGLQIWSTDYRHFDSQKNKQHLNEWLQLQKSVIWNLFRKINMQHMNNFKKIWKVLPVFRVLCRNVPLFWGIFDKSKKIKQKSLDYLILHDNLSFHVKIKIKTFLLVWAKYEIFETFLFNFFKTLSKKFLK